MRKLVSTLTGREYPFERLEEFADNGEALEVAIAGIERARPRPGHHLWERFAEFLPFKAMDASASLGEGNTPLVDAGGRLKSFAGIDRLLLKNETQNPTWSFKDRGSLACIFMAQEMGERTTATISTGNMGHSIAAYGARAGIKPLVFVPEFAPREKLMAMTIHGATVIRVRAPDYAGMKKAVLGLAKDFKLRIVSGNGPIRVEGYKLTAFELFEQLQGEPPDYIAVPTSACGHIRGLFKGFRELLAAGLIRRLPRMIVVQAANNSPIVSAIKQGAKHIIPFSNFHTVAEAITTGNPMGGDEIIAKAYAARLAGRRRCRSGDTGSPARVRAGGLVRRAGHRDCALRREEAARGGQNRRGRLGRPDADRRRPQRPRRAETPAVQRHREHPRHRAARLGACSWLRWGLTRSFCAVAKPGTVRLAGGHERRNRSCHRSVVRHWS